MERRVDRNRDARISLFLSLRLSAHRRHSDRNNSRVLTIPLSFPPSASFVSKLARFSRPESWWIEIPPRRSGDRGSRGTPPGTRIEHLVAAPDEGSAQEEGSGRGGRDARGGECVALA